MPKITKQQAREFLEKIKPEDKIAIIHHDDLDGFSSGILLYDFCKFKDCKNIKHLCLGTEPISDYIKEQIKDCNKLIIADIPPFYISDYLKDYSDKEILYIDHHQPDTEISEFILEYRVYKQYSPASKLTYELTEKENKSKEWLAMAGMITDYAFAYKENEEIINSFLKKENITLHNYRKEVANKISSFLIYFNKEKNKSFEILQKVESWKDLNEIKKYSEEVENEIKAIEKDFNENKERIGKINLYMFHSIFPLKSVIATILSEKNPNETFIIMSQNKGENDIHLSARYQNERADVISLLKVGIKNLKNSSAGGHLRAAGGYLQAQDLPKFKENIREYSETLK